ncbi:hypothetical protein Dimus_009836 [Dionaea muscipula]
MSLTSVGLAAISSLLSSPPVLMLLLLIMGNFFRTCPVPRGFALPSLHPLHVLLVRQIIFLPHCSTTRGMQRKIYKNYDDALLQILLCLIKKIVELGDVIASCSSKDYL